MRRKPAEVSTGHGLQAWLRSGVCGAILALPLLAVAADEDPFATRLEPKFTPVPLGTKRNASVFLDADEVNGVAEGVLRAKGNAQLRQRGLFMRADELDYDQSAETIEARGSVVI